MTWEALTVWSVIIIINKNNNYTANNKNKKVTCRNASQTKEPLIPNKVQIKLVPTYTLSDILLIAWRHCWQSLYKVRAWLGHLTGRNNGA